MNRASSTPFFWRILALASAALLCSGSTADRSRVRAGAGAVVEIPAGWFTMGSSDDDIAYVAALCALDEHLADSCKGEMFRDELPAHRVFVGRFRIDRYEVSNRDYRRCVLANACSPSRIADTDRRLGLPRFPVAGVTWAEADAYCRFRGGRLPTEAEWERAARGNLGRRFPWGNLYNSRLANHGSGNGEPDAIDGYRFAAPVDAFIDGRSAIGLMNMAGNVWELTADRYAVDYYDGAQRVDPGGPLEGDRRVIRGGSWRSPAFTLRVTQRAGVEQDESRPDLGFRCAYDAP
jgi:sulfatase modifying factor 1